MEERTSVNVCTNLAMERNNWKIPNKKPNHPSGSLFDHPALFSHGEPGTRSWVRAAAFLQRSQLI